MTVIDMPPAPGSIALVDLNYLFKKRYHTIGNETPMAAAKATLKDLEWLREGVDHVIICRDAPPYNRAQHYPAYKANRPKPEPEETAQKRWLFEQLKSGTFNIAWSEGHEADDIIATLAAKYSTWCTDVRILGVDKDMAQCLNENVVQYIPPHGDKDWERRDAAAATEKFGVEPSLMVFYQGLVGDKSDNIPGVPGIGPKTGAELVNKHRTPTALATAIAAEPHAFKASVVKALADNWDKLTLSIKLATLDTSVALDFDGLLVKRTPQPAPAPVTMEPKPSNDYAEALEEAARLYEQKFPPPSETRASATEEEYVDEQNERERRENEEHVEEPRPAPRKWGKAGPLTLSPITVPSYTQSQYGMVTADLQPVDLTAAYQMSEWLLKSNLFQQYKSEAQIFTIMMRAKELGIGVTAALANHHIIDGKPVAHADLIRALAERDPNFGYLMPLEFSATRVVWQGRNKAQPKAVDYAYTIEEANEAGLLTGPWGKIANWKRRPQDMLMKTAASKLARLLFPVGTMGLYCPEELGYTMEQLDQREAA